MDSLEVFLFKENIKRYIEDNALPYEVKRMCLAEIYAEVEKSALQEILQQAEEREKQNG